MSSKRKTRSSAAAAASSAPPAAAQDSSDSGSDSDSDGTVYVAQYELERRARIRSNNAYLATLGLSGLKEEMGFGGSGGGGGGKRRRTAPSKGLASGTKKPRVPRPPTRTSSRQRGEASDGAHVLGEVAGRIVSTMNVGGQYGAENEEEAPRRDDDPVETEDAADRAILASVAGLKAARPAKGKAKAKPAASRYAGLKLAEADVVKVCREKLYAVACHPSADKLVVAAGDKRGMLAVVDLDRAAADDDDHANDGVVASYPHSGAINTLYFLPEDPSKLVSTSYDGSLRSLDLATGTSTFLYGAPHDLDLWVTYSCLLPGRGGFLVSGSDGTVSRVDPRAGNAPVWSLTLADGKQKKINTVHCHPTDPNVFCTAGNERVCRVWDARKASASASASATFKKTAAAMQLAALEDSYSVNSAFWSPDGEAVLTGGYSDRLRLFKAPHKGREAAGPPFMASAPKGTKGKVTACSASLKGKSVAPDAELKHDMHTGRFHSTFHAVWDPKHSDAFVCGAMEQPRVVRVFSVSADKTRMERCAALRDADLLASVQSRNVFHPAMNAVVCGNASGRVHVFR